MKVLVCGGRDFNDRAWAFKTLDAISEMNPITAVITGGARGADAYGEQWAVLRGLPVVVFEANWRLHGRKAGPIRNQRMLDEAKPDYVVAFPGGAGTADMVRRAKATGVPVWKEAK